MIDTTSDKAAWNAAVLACIERIHRRASEEDYRARVRESRRFVGGHPISPPLWMGGTAQLCSELAEDLRELMVKP